MNGYQLRSTLTQIFIDSGSDMQRFSVTRFDDRGLEHMILHVNNVNIGSYSIPIFCKVVIGDDGAEILDINNIYTSIFVCPFNIFHLPC